MKKVINEKYFLEISLTWYGFCGGVKDFIFLFVMEKYYHEL